MKSLQPRGLLALTVMLAVASATAPVAIFHGLGDACSNPGMSQITKHIGEQLGATAKCIEIGSGAESSIFMNFEKQAEAACKTLLADPDFQGEFSVMGLSQGGLIARYIVEECQTKVPVRNIVTMGAPHMGVDATPHCFNGIICYPANFLVKSMVYTSFVQNHVGPAGYFRDPSRLNTYKEKSVFLPALNNEGASQNSNRASRFSSLNDALFVMFAKDSMIFPKESAIFGEIQSDKKTVLPYDQTDLYKNDLIGLKSLVEAGKATFTSLPGDHLRFTLDDVDKLVVPHLKK